MFRVQVLADTKRRWQSAINMKTRNLVWLNVAQVSRLTVAEKIAANLRVDSPSVITRIRPNDARGHRSAIPFHRTAT